MIKTIEDLLDNPDYIATLDDATLTKLLQPYFPAVRTPLMPEEKAPAKQGTQHQAIMALINSNKEAVERLKAIQKK